MEEDGDMNTLKEAGKTYISLETDLQETGIKENMFRMEALNEILSQEKSFSSPDNTFNVADLDQLLSISCYDAKKKIDEIYLYKSKLLETYNSFLKEESERHTEEMNRKLEELHSLKQSLAHSENTVHKNYCIIDNLSEALLAEKNKFLSYKVFHAWRKQCVSAQRDKFLSDLATKHYEEKLKRKFFCSWYQLTECNWKERIERSVRFNIRESQKCLVEEYEIKIKNIENELKQSQIKIGILESNHKFYEDAMKQALLRGVCALNMETLNIFRNSSELISQSSSSLLADKASLQSEVSSPKQCPKCMWSPSETSSEFIKKCSSLGNGSLNDETLSQKHPKVQPMFQLGCIPVMGTCSTSSMLLQESKPQSKDSNPDTNFCCPKRNISVQRHATKATTNTTTTVKNSKLRESMNSRFHSKR